MKNILVTSDFNKDEELLNHAGKLAEAFDSKIWLVHIVAPEADSIDNEGGPKGTSDGSKEHIQLQEYATKLTKNGVNAEGLLVQGSTIEMVIEKAKKLNVDLIIAGHREHSFFYKSLVGSISAGIIKKSKIPVLIVPLE